MYRSNVDQFFLFMIYNKIKLLILLNDCIKSSNNLNIALLIFNYLLKVVELEYQVQYIFCNKTEGLQYNNYIKFTFKPKHYSKLSFVFLASIVVYFYVVIAYLSSK